MSLGFLLVRAEQRPYGLPLERVVEVADPLRIGEAEPQRRALVERIEPRVAPQPVERLVARRDRQPCGRPIRHAVERPAHEGDAECVLDRILDQVEPPRPEQTRQPRRDLSRLAAKEVVDQRFCLGGLGHGIVPRASMIPKSGYRFSEKIMLKHDAHIWSTWRTSMVPP